MKGNYNGNAPFLISPVQGLGLYANVNYSLGCAVVCNDTSGFAGMAVVGLHTLGWLGCAAVLFGHRKTEVAFESDSFVKCVCVCVCVCVCAAFPLLFLFLFLFLFMTLRSQLLSRPRPTPMPLLLSLELMR